MYSAVQYCTVLYSNVQYYTVHCTVLYSTVLYSTPVPVAGYRAGCSSPYPVPAAGYRAGCFSTLPGAGCRLPGRPLYGIPPRRGLSNHLVVVLFSLRFRQPRGGCLSSAVKKYKSGSTINLVFLFPYLYPAIWKEPAIQARYRYI